MAEKDFEITDSGEIVRKNYVEKPKTQRQIEEQEYTHLQYLINNHPDRLKDGDRERFEYLHKKLEMPDPERSGNALKMKMAQLKLQAKMESGNTLTDEELMQLTARQNG